MQVFRKYRELMRRAMRFAFILVPLFCFLWLTGIARAESGLSGRWSGTFSCDQNDDNDMSLDIEEKNGRLKAIFSFDVGEVRGSYNLAGKLRSDGTFSLVPQQWIERPPRSRAYGIRGALKPDKIEGRILPCKAGFFAAIRGAPISGSAAAAGPVAKNVRATPAVKLAGALSGPLASAASADDQCRIIEEWLGKYVNWKNIARMTRDGGLLSLSQAFEDEAFTPVFGVPFLNTTQEERSSVAILIRNTCKSRDLLRFVGDNVFASERQFQTLVGLMVEHQDNQDWLAGAKTELESLPSGKSGLDRIARLRTEFRTRLPNIPQNERREFEQLLSAREAGTKAMAVFAELDKIPDDSFENGGLDRVLAFMQRAWNNVDERKARRDRKYAVQVREFRHELTVRSEAKARAILNRPLRDAAAAAGSFPATLEGLKQGYGVLKPLQPYRQPMDRWFGTIDRDGITSPLLRRLDEIRNDSGVQAAFRETLLAVAKGPEAKSAVKAKAAEYIDVDNLDSTPEYARILYEVSQVAEARAVSIIDLSGSEQEGEPTAEEIASFALQRIQDYNSNAAAMEQYCMRGGAANNPVEAFGCLGQPGVVTGRKGFAARLIEIRKIGCVAEVSGARYLCDFTQEIAFNAPGADPFGARSLDKMARAATKNEPVKARFIKAANGGWNVIWGDLNR
jgi:hypothetical protein